MYIYILPRRNVYIFFTIDVEKGLRGVHADKSAASICKLRQWRSQQPSCLDYIVLDDRLSVIDCNIICECSVTATREGSPVVRLKQPATQILTALLLRQRRWDMPLGTMHCAASKCQLIQQFATIQVTKCAIRSVRWSQLFSLLWSDLLEIRRLPSHEVAPTKSQCRSADFAQWNAK